MSVQPAGITVRNLTRVPVEELCFGLYVVELDRPWHEVPVMFQGFEIVSEEELQVLRQHCEHVYVEEERSTPEARAALVGARPAPAAPAAGSAAGMLLRRPGKADFGARLRVAGVEHRKASDYLAQALQDVRLGRTVDWRPARGVVQDLAERVIESPAAMLWLNRLGQKDDAISAHSVNVCVLALVFAAERGLHGEQLQNIGLGALLHDVGKINQDQAVLTKQSPLDRAEWTAMQRHPLDGAVLVGSGISAEVLNIIAMHHEHLDGSGYPHGLRGEAEFPEHARLVALANAYDSLTSERPYRAALPADQALQELYNQRHASYGAELVQEFIHCLGVFPVGSVVELNNGSLGVVVESNPISRLKPAVLLVRTPDGQPYEKRLLINLAATPDAGEGQAAQYIRRAVDPADYGIDVAAIIAFEFGLDW